MTRESEVLSLAADVAGRIGAASFGDQMHRCRLRALYDDFRDGLLDFIRSSDLPASVEAAALAEADRRFEEQCAARQIAGWLPSVGP